MALSLLEDSYVTLAEADSSLEGLPTWDEASETEQENALKSATAVLDRQTGWLGVAVDPDQPLAWPRSDFSYFDPRLNLYVSVPEGTIPRLLKRATYELALHYLEYPDVGRKYEATWDSITVGPISLSNVNANSDPGAIPRVPYAVLDLISALQGKNLNQGTAWWRAN